MSNPSRLLNLSMNLALLALPLAAADAQITGPFQQGNLSIYLIHSAGHATARPLLTLQEAMEQKKAVVYETGSVNELSIENTSSQDVFIQSGDIVKGGRQDRVLTTDFILPAHSGKRPIAAFCVEEGRWTKRGSESAEQFSASNAAVPGKALKVAVHSANSGNQGEVWTQVASTRTGLGGVAGAPPPRPAGGSPDSHSYGMRSASTSMQTALEDPAVEKAIAAYTAKLQPLAEGQTDVVGFVYAINGKLDSGDVYDSHELFVRMWPKLLRASAAEAVEDKAKSAIAAPAPEISAVNAIMSDAEKAPAASTQVTGRLTVMKRETAQALLFETIDQKAEGRWLHRSYVVK